MPKVEYLPRLRIEISSTITVHFVWIHPFLAIVLVVTKDTNFNSIYLVIFIFAGVGSAHWQLYYDQATKALLPCFVRSSQTLILKSTNLRYNTTQILIVAARIFVMILRLIFFILHSTLGHIFFSCVNLLLFPPSLCFLLGMVVLILLGYVVWVSNRAMRVKHD